MPHQSSGELSSHGALGIAALCMGTDNRIVRSELPSLRG